MTKAREDVQTPSQWNPDWGSQYIAVVKRGSTSATATAENFIRYGKIRPGTHILDMGCGHGRIMELLVNHVPRLEIVAIDLTRELLTKFLVEPGMNHCKLHRVQVNLDNGALPFGNNEFDVAISARVFQYLSDPARAVCEAYRVVKPGGTAIISVPNRLNPVKYLTYRRAKLYTPFDVASWFHSCGFRNVRYGSMCFFPSSNGWHRLATLVEQCARVPALRLIGGNAVVSGTKQP